MPTYYPEDSKEEIPEEYFDEELFQFTDDSIKYEEEEQWKHTEKNQKSLDMKKIA